MFRSIAVIFVICLFASFVFSNEYPVPTPPHKRQAVHGWLILPMEQDLPDWENTNKPVQAWFSHHVPEFYTQSPHNFQIIIRGTLTPMAYVENVSMPILLPYPPKYEIVGHEFTFTPPPPFSLNNLLNGDTTVLRGVVYNGSFDTSYERKSMNIGTFNINELTTAVYLNYSSAVVPFSVLTYYSYPRAITWNGNAQQHFYLSHFIHAAPDFNQIVQGIIDLSQCTCSSLNECPSTMEEWWNAVNLGGSVWTFDYLPNNIYNRLSPSSNQLYFGYLSAKELNCPFTISEEIHCTVGPGFAETCSYYLEYY